MKHSSPFDDLPVGTLRHIEAIGGAICESVEVHAAIMFADPDHVCAEPTDDDLNGMVLDDEDLRVYLALEHSLLLLFQYTRAALKLRGEPVQTLQELLSEMETHAEG